MNVLKILKETLLTLVSGSCFAGSLLGVSAWFHWSIPEPQQRPVFFVGLILFSLTFRLLIHVRTQEE